MINLEPHVEGTILPVRAAPGARHKGIHGEYRGMLKVRVTQVAEKGKANKAIERAVAAALGVRTSAVDVVAGHASRDKSVRVLGLSVVEARNRLAAVVGGSKGKAR